MFEKLLDILNSLAFGYGISEVLHKAVNTEVYQELI